MYAYFIVRSHMAALCSGQVFVWGGQYSSPEPKWLVHASSNATLFAFNTFFFESLMLRHRISCGAVSTWVANTSSTALAKWNLNTPQKSGNVLQSSLLFPELYNAPNTPRR